MLIAFVKVSVARPRPPYFFLDPADIFQSINQYSFPSGHVLFFVVFFGFIAYLAWLHQTGFARILVIAICSALVLLIGPSRVYLGAHWASDVVGSYIIGILWLFVLILGYQMVVAQENYQINGHLTCIRQGILKSLLGFQITLRDSNIWCDTATGLLENSFSLDMKSRMLVRMKEGTVPFPPMPPLR